MIKPSKTAIEGYGGEQCPVAVSEHGKPSESPGFAEYGNNPQVAEIAADVAARLVQNTQGVAYGSAEVTLKIHDGRILSVTYSQTRSVREVQI